jgi:catechol 2,3-dioxygenase-like lactoylglutathione lyase family enzyme
MLDRVDRVLLAVRDRSAGVATFDDVLGAEFVREDRLGAPYNARRSVVQAGDSEFELLEPDGEGLVSQHLERWREGIFAAGFSTSDLPEITRRLDAAKLTYERHGDQIFIEPDQTMGMRTVLQQSASRDEVGGISGLYEVTNIVEDHERAASFYAQIFGLDQSRFSPITSEHFGYTGTLTLFDPPARLDRIEITQITQDSLAMGRFFARRGPSVYMCYAETGDVEALSERLETLGARFEPFGDGMGLFIHPSALCGMLMGVSGTNVGWRWSGRPELAPARAS